jgi:small subunit ribosomal protein S3
MGQKVHPFAFRLGYNKTWLSLWFNEKNYAKQLLEDIKLREILTKRLKTAGIDRIGIERSANMIHFVISVARPGVVIGKGGTMIEELNQDLTKITGAKVKIDIKEVAHADLSAKVVADSVARQIERRINYRRAIKQSIDKAMQAGAKGIKIKVAGRLNGAEIARKEWAKDGSIPLHTLRSDVDYAIDTSFTTYGCVGVKVWIYKGVKTQIEDISEGNA